MQLEPHNTSPSPQLYLDGTSKPNCNGMVCISSVLCVCVSVLCSHLD